MDLMSVVEEVLRDGCDVSLSQVLKSERYQELCEREKKLAAKHSRRSHRGLAYRTGHLQMGRLLNTLPEREALAQARNAVLPSDPNTEVRALILLLGEQLVAAAEKCLPVEALEMAQDWQRGDVENQISIARELYRLLRGEDLDEAGKREYNWETWPLYLASRRDEIFQESSKRILPKQYGPWGQGGKPNCQGKAQMLAAFANLAGTRTFTADPLIDAGMVKTKWQSRVFQMVEDDIANRGIRHVDKTFQESCEVAGLHHSFDRHDHSFHVCISMQLSDGRWVMVDPHALSWGVLSSHYDMGRIDRILTKYREVLPGLSLIGSDTETEERLFQERITEAEHWLAQSRKMQEVIEREDRNPIAITEALAQSGDAIAIAKAFGIEPETFEILQTLGEGGLNYLAMLLFWQTSDPWEMMDLSYRMMVEPEFLAKKIGSLLTVYHCIALNMFRDQVSHAGLLVHPVCEFRNTEYDLALSAINSLRKVITPGEAKFFLDNQFSQIVLSNALHELGLLGGFGCHERDPSLGVAAARALQVLPVRHPICDRKLSIVASLLKGN